VGEWVSLHWSRKPDLEFDKEDEDEVDGYLYPTIIVSTLYTNQHS
jgi:hypothetical protein